MFETLFGAGWPLPVQFLVAFVIVLLLIGATFWLIRRFGTTPLGTTSSRGRQPRLAVIDATAVDARRRLVLIRRDNVEHLVMIGGPTDLIVEQNIVRAVPVAPPREIGREPPVRPAPDPRLAVEDWEPPPRPEPARAEIAPRPQPDHPSRPLPERGEPRPEVAPRAHGEPGPRALRPEPPLRPRAPAPEPTPPRAAPEPRMPEPRMPEPRMPEPRMPEPVVRAPEPPAPRIPVPPEAPVTRPMAETVAPPPIVPAAEPEERGPDANLATMAQRLEAALRRPFAGPPPAAGEPEAPHAAEPRAPLRFEPLDEEPEAPRAAEERPHPAAEAPRPAPRAEPARGEPARQRSVLDSLEEEMASLLGRPPGKE